jgi:hypothetical protein
MKKNSFIFIGQQTRMVRKTGLQRPGRWGRLPGSMKTI